ncbi:hypothetical protein Tco_0828405 [Tanacetum coccineum]
MIIQERFLKIVKAKGERKSLSSKAKKKSSDEECLTFESEDEEYAMAVRDFKKFFKRRGRFVRQPRNDKKTFQRSHDDKNGKAVKEDVERSIDETCLVGSCIKEAALKAIMGPPPVSTPGSEKNVSFQKSILGPRPKHIIVNNVKVPVASDNEVKQFYKPLSKPRVGFSKPNCRSKTPPPRRVNNNYPRPKTLSHPQTGSGQNTCPRA